MSKFSQLKIKLTDMGQPKLTARKLATVDIDVHRNLQEPKITFSQPNITILPNQSVSTSLVNISTDDADTKAPFNIVKLKLIGDDSALDYFNISSTYSIVLIKEIASVNTLSFRVSSQCRTS